MLIAAKGFRARESGSYLLFFAVGVLPLLLFMLALSVDVGNYMRAQQRLQKTADDAALLAWRYFPYHSEAVSAVNAFIAQRGLSQTIAQVRMAPARTGSQDFSDEFEVILQEQLPLSFMSYLAQDAALPIRTSARARSTPLDVYIAVDRSVYMAPQQLNSVWPSSAQSPFFASVPFTSFQDPQNGNSLVLDPPEMFMSQLCFNPYFAGVKSSAIALYEYFAAAGRNGVGIGVFPGVSLDYVRDLRAVLRPQQTTVASDPMSGEAAALQLEGAASPQQDFYQYGNVVPLGASSWCAAASVLTPGFEAVAPYGTGTSAKVKKIWMAPAGASTLPSEITRRIGSSVEFNPSYQSALTVREALWSAVAKSGTPNSRGVVDRTIANLASTPDSEAIGGLAIRGGLTGTSTRTGIILAGDVPYFNTSRFADSGDTVSAQLSQSFAVLRQILVANPTLRFKLIYVVVNDSLRPPLETPLDLPTRTANLAAYFEQEENLQDFAGRLELQVISGNSLRELNEQILATVILDNSRKVLSS